MSTAAKGLRNFIQLLLIASQTFYNEDYEGEITLSSKKAHDKLWGGTLPDITGWSTSGTYASIQVETDKHLFKGEIILAPKGVKKTKKEDDGQTPDLSKALGLVEKQKQEEEKKVVT